MMVEPYLIGVPKGLQRMSFDNFEVTDENRTNVERCKGIQQDSAYLYGEPGRGKTHLAVAIARNQFPEWQARRDTASEDRWSESAFKELGRWGDDTLPQRVRLVAWQKLIGTPEKFAAFGEVHDQIGLSLSRCRESRFFRWMDLVHDAHKFSDSKLIPGVKSAPELIIIDDALSSNLSDFTIGVLYDILDARFSNELPTIVTGNLSIDEIASTEDRIASRLAAHASIMEMRGSDYRDKLGQARLQRETTSEFMRTV